VRNRGNRQGGSLMYSCSISTRGNGRQGWKEKRTPRESYGERRQDKTRKTLDAHGAHLYSGMGTGWNSMKSLQHLPESGDACRKGGVENQAGGKRGA